MKATRESPSTTPLLEKLDYMGPADWFKRVLLDPSITSAYNVNGNKPLIFSVATDQYDTADSETKARPFLPRVKAYLSYLAKKVFVETYEFDGLHLSKATYTGADGIKRNYSDDKLPLSMIIWSLLGFPNRPLFLNNLNNKDPVGLEHNLFSILKNMMGGSLHPTKQTFIKHGRFLRMLLALGLLVELLVIKPIILLIKFAEVFFKIPLNILKLVTESTPSFLKNITGTLMGLSAKNLAHSKNLYNKGSKSIGKLLSTYFVFGISLLMITPLHYAFRIATIIGTALTSPLKSAKSAWTLGSSFAISDKIGNFNYISVIIVGSIFLALSIALSAALWAIALPLVFTGLTTLIPALNGVVSALLSTPLIASSMATISASITSAWAYLGLTSAFAYVSTALAASIGVHIAAANLALGVGVGLIAAPVAIVAARFAAAFANGWARLNQMNFRSAFFPMFFKDKKSHSGIELCGLPDLHSQSGSDHTRASYPATQKVREMNGSYYAASTAAFTTDAYSPQNKMEYPTSGGSGFGLPGNQPQNFNDDYGTGSPRFGSDS